MAFHEDGCVLTVDGKAFKAPVSALGRLRIQPGLLWASLTFPAPDGSTQTVKGLPNGAAKSLQQSVQQLIAKEAHRQKIAQLIQDFPQSIAPLLEWARTLHSGTQTRLKQRGWVAKEFIRRTESIRPTGFNEWLADPDVQAILQTQPEDVQQALALWKQDLKRWAQGINEQQQKRALQTDKAFLDTVEKSPLTEEQTKAVVCFDSRILLVAAAGSGKTSTMVAKAGYALHKGYFAPESILLLAFNNDAAAELRERLKARLQPLGLPAERVSAKTFHAFGLEVIGQSTGQKPTVAPWVESGRDLDQLLIIVDDLKDQDPLFRIQWDLFRVVLGQDLPAFGKEQEAPDSWNRETGEDGFWTLNNEVVKSRGEQMIANWLFYNGVQYQYEPAYEHPTADAQYRQYRPDFYLPQAKAYLEHWAVDERGEPPAGFVGYKESMVWKRALHAQHGTTLLQTTMADLWSGRVFMQLTQDLEALGVTLDPNPERPVPGRQPIENPRLAQTFRTFLTHVKSNRLTREELQRRLDQGEAGRFRFRHQMFLDLFDRIRQGWESALQSQGFIDFDDMLNLAADCIEQKRWHNPYELVMVDEFQDASQARARMAKALVDKPDACLFAVGDDWQSINRFAGADLGVMTHFQEVFGDAVTLKLETTFRCPPSLCNISSQFVQKNQAQLRKAVRSPRPDVPEPVQITRVDDDKRIAGAVFRLLCEIGEQAAISNVRQKVLLLGRYNKERMYLPSHFQHPLVDVEFLTVHTSKGLECDHVIVPRMTRDTFGFPSRIPDDPVMHLAMPDGDDHEFAEERRLFYVAMSRAKQTVRLITVKHSESAFVIELIKDLGLKFRGAQGEATDDRLCPVCEEGFMVRRKGPFGVFLGCSRYPRCKHKEQIAKHPTGQRLRP